MGHIVGIELFDRHLTALVYKNPALRPIELRARTGESTAVVTRPIYNPDIEPRFEVYMYTDVNPSFF